ncbi:hypothetical protein HanIR_Chr09g0449031 [Helianthus annuus]|nr:hypothetical protein HanIR_Chr09g0449031 [Helianthus annuus]
MIVQAGRCFFLSLDQIQLQLATGVSFASLAGTETITNLSGVSNNCLGPSLDFKLELS